MITGMVTTKFDELARTDPDKAKQYWKRIERIVGNDRPNPFKQPVAQPVYWIHEANMIMRVSTFKEIGGFDANLRYHDIFPVAIELKKRGMSCHFDPRISVTHKAINVRNENRREEEKKAERYLFKKYRFKMFY